MINPAPNTLEEIPLPDGLKCYVLPESDIRVGGPFGGTIVRTPYGFGEIRPDEDGSPYSLVAAVRYPSDRLGPNGVTGAYICAHNYDQLRERAMEKVEEWRAILKP